MGKIMAWCAGLALAGMLAGCGQSPAAGGVSWGRVIEVPGLGALNTGKGGSAEVSAVSCASPGNCAAGGYYTDKHGHGQGFVAGERDGRWGTATGVPGLAAMNVNGYAGVLSVSCASPGSCAAGGSYVDPYDPYGRSDDGFLVSEKNGAWGKAADFTGENGAIEAVSCTSAGNCLAGGWAAGDYAAPSYGFIARERNGRWGQQETGLPGLGALNAGGDAAVGSAWCAAAGNCVAGGYYTDKHGNSQAFVAGERNGPWGKAIAVPGLAALNKGGNAQVNSVSCGSPGTCVAGGYYTAKNGRTRAFAVLEQNGRWETAVQVPGLAALDKYGRPTAVSTVSCAPAGGCAVGGYYADRSHHRQGFVATEDNGNWTRPIPLPGLAVLNTGGYAEVTSLSCPAPGSCTASGFYSSRPGHYLGFVTQNR
jgi:hypothetical protein